MRRNRLLFVILTQLLVLVLLYGASGCSRKPSLEAKEKGWNVKASNVKIITHGTSSTGETSQTISYILTNRNSEPVHKIIGQRLFSIKQNGKDYLMAPFEDSVIYEGKIEPGRSVVHKWKQSRKYLVTNVELRIAAAY